jgi:hypothetical protein
MNTLPMRRSMMRSAQGSFGAFRLVQGSRVVNRVEPARRSRIAFAQEA